MTSRYYVSEPLAPGEHVLEGAEAHHLLHVMRARVGDQIQLFDGLGAEAEARILACDRRTATVAVKEILRRDLELTAPLRLGVALPKGDRQKWLLEKAVELGVTSLTPLITRRGVAQPTDSALERLRRGVIEASKQCGRNQLLELTAPCELPAWMAGASSEAQRWIAHPGPASIAPAPRAGPLWAAVGPEGGFTDEEFNLASELGWQGVTLGPRILRVETAALAIAAVVGLRC